MPRNDGHTPARTRKRRKALGILKAKLQAARELRKRRGDKP